MERPRAAFGYDAIVYPTNMFPGRFWEVLILLNLHVFVSFVSLGSISTLISAELSEFQSVHVGVVLDMNSVVGSMADICLSMALDDFYDMHYDYQTRLVLHKRHSDNVLSAASTAIGLLKTGEVVAIVGPQSSIEATFVIELGRQVQVPVLTFSVTSPSISHAKNPYFIRTAQNDSYQVQALTELIQGFRWNRIILIYEDTVYGNGIIPYLMDSLQKSNIKITYKCAFLKEANSSEITKELNKMKGLKAQVFLVHMMTTSLASQLFEQANAVGLMSRGYAWIITDGLSNSLDDLVPIAIDSMDGVLGIRPYIPKSIALGNFKSRWKKKFHSTKPDSSVSELNIFGLWAYDTMWALARAVEDTRPLHSPLYYRKFQSNDSDPITNLGILREGPKLLNNILNSKPVQGLSGEFHIVNGQLEPLALEIFNVIGNGERVIGFWSPKNGIARSLKSGEKPSPSSVDNLRKIIWPGDSTVKPLGTGIPRTLKIVVPKNVSFPGLVESELNQTDNEIMFKGYCIDVFRAAVKALPDSDKFEYELLYYPFHDSSSSVSSNSSSYDDMLFQVYNKTIDGVVGDTSIMASRWYVDFTMPYSDSGVTMVVPSISEAGSIRDTFVFLKPFYFGLWVAIVVSLIASFASICFIRYAHNYTPQNENQKVVTDTKWHLIWIPTAAIFGQGDDKLDNRSRMVLIVLLLGMSLMMGSYTASFISIIIAETHNRKVDLNANDVYIGYQTGSSIVKDILLKKLRIDESRIRSYSTLEQYEKALSQGSSKGGVSAIIDETPYLKLFLAKYGSKYKLDGPIYKTEGFAFAFPVGSPLVSQMSKAIVNITKSGEIEEIQWKYFGVRDSFENKIYTETSKFSFWNFSSLFLMKAFFLFLIFISMPQIRLMAYNEWPMRIWGKIKAIAGMRRLHTSSASTTTQGHTSRLGNIEDGRDESSTSTPITIAESNTDRLQNNQQTTTPFYP